VLRTRKSAPSLAYAGTQPGEPIQAADTWPAVLAAEYAGGSRARVHDDGAYHAERRGQCAVTQQLPTAIIATMQ
jgi:hypothetical protein